MKQKIINLGNLGIITTICILFFGQISFGSSATKKMSKQATPFRQANFQHPETNSETPQAVKFGRHNNPRYVTAPPADELFGATSSNMQSSPRADQDSFSDDGTYEAQAAPPGPSEGQARGVIAQLRAARKKGRAINLQNGFSLDSTFNTWNVTQASTDGPNAIRQGTRSIPQQMPSSHSQVSESFEDNIPLSDLHENQKMILLRNLSPEAFKQLERSGISPKAQEQLVREAKKIEIASLIRPRGLENYSHNCFMNASLQCCLRMKILNNSIREFVLRPEIQNQIMRYVQDWNEIALCNSYIQLYNEWEPKDHKNFCSQAWDLFYPQEEHSRQQDVNLFLHRLFDKLEWFANKNRSTTFTDLLYLQETVTEFVPTNREHPDGYLEDRPENLSPILNIEITGESLISCLDKYFSEEEVPAIETGCMIQMQRSISKLPYYLCIALKRGHATQNSNGQFVTNVVRHGTSFELTQDIKNYMHPDSTDQNTQYALLGVIFFSGSDNNGHYTSCIRLNSQWFHCDDNKIELISMENMHTISKAGKIKLNNNLLLPVCFFYEKIAPNGNLSSQQSQSDHSNVAPSHQEGNLENRGFGSVPNNHLIDHKNLQNNGFLAKAARTAPDGFAQVNKSHYVRPSSAKRNHIVADSAAQHGQEQDMPSNNAHASISPQELDPVNSDHVQPGDAKHNQFEANSAAQDREEQGTRNAKAHADSTTYEFGVINPPAQSSITPPSGKVYVNLNIAAGTSPHGFGGGVTPRKANQDRSEVSAHATSAAQHSITQSRINFSRPRRIEGNPYTNIHNNKFRGQPIDYSGFFAAAWDGDHATFYSKIVLYTDEEQTRIFTAKDNDGMTLLHITAANNHRSLCVHILNASLSTVLWENNAGEMPLHLAVKEGRARIIHFLIRAIQNKCRKKDLTTQLETIQPQNNQENLERKPLPPVHLAVFYDREDALDKLLNLLKEIADGRKNEDNGRGTKLIETILEQPVGHGRYRPLHLACIAGAKGMVKKLLSKNVDIYALDFYERTPLQLAVIHKNYHLIPMLLGAEKTQGILDRQQSEDNIFKALTLATKLGFEDCRDALRSREPVSNAPQQLGNAQEVTKVSPKNTIAAQSISLPSNVGHRGRRHRSSRHLRSTENSQHNASEGRGRRHRRRRHRGRRHRSPKHLRSTENSQRNASEGRNSKRHSEEFGSASSENENSQSNKQESGVRSRSNSMQSPSQSTRRKNWQFWKKK